ncbi:MAG: hemerythrin domain-containing protein [Alphaproteobacteria bacterium]|nr:hemerythrin domain-containing protein [Alphaproteobacteria bacterium]MDX5368415.1 hemerythrin domain-containing protein [Alphaproteobacteria bacterium]MDX5463210.1 hemerythrin domain-containing protein [Alphaproteobacteria bacterium]
MTSEAQSAGAQELPEETGALIGHILERYHETHRRELAELAALAEKVERVHGDHPDAPRGLADALRRMTGELEVHMKKEELILFPLMRRGGAPMIRHPILQMRHDHDDHAAAIARLLDLTHGLEIPEGACRSWRALYEGTAKLIADVTRHIEIENTILFPRFESLEQTQGDAA